MVHLTFIAASVGTLVVSEMKLLKGKESVFKDALVIPRSMGLHTAGKPYVL